MDDRAKARIEKLLGVGDEPAQPADPTPIERMLSAASPMSAPLTLDDEVIFPPWEPTGDETPKKTVELDDSRNPYTVPPPETAGGSIPSAFAQFRKYGPDES